MTIPFPESVRPAALFEVAFEWDHKDNEKSIAAWEAIRNLKCPDDVYFTDCQMGGACWGSYLTIKGSHFGHVKDFTEKVLRLLKRKGCELYSMDTGTLT